MVEQTKAIAESKNFIVLDKYERIENTSNGYQSEDDLERELILDLVNQSYEFRPDITSPRTMLANVRVQLQVLNSVIFSDGEWARFVDTYLDRPSEGIIDKTRKLHDDYIHDFIFDDGRIQNIYLVEKRNKARNKLQVIKQFERTGSHANRYDVTILVNGLPLVQIELKKRGVAIREAFNQIHRYSKESFNSDNSLFKFLQLFIISNGTGTRDFANTTKRNKNSFDFTINWAKSDNGLICDLRGFTATFLQKRTFLDVLQQYSVFDVSETLLIMRRAARPGGLTMSDLPSTIASKIADLRARFILHERFEPLQARFRMLLEKRLADIAAGRSADAHGIALSGASGTGKSCAMAQLIARARVELAHSSCTEATIISLRVPFPATLKFLGQMILRALGYNLSAERQAWYIWDLARHQLRQGRVLFLHLDEAQGLSSRGTTSELNAVASMLKTLMTDPDWPVGILLSGTEELEPILNHDPQLARRMDAVHFAPLSPLIHAPDVIGLIGKYAIRADLTAAPDSQTIASAERMIHASAFQIGLVRGKRRCGLAGQATASCCCTDSGKPRYPHDPWPRSLTFRHHGPAMDRGRRCRFPCPRRWPGGPASGAGRHETRPCQRFWPVSGTVSFLLRVAALPR